MTSLLTSFLTLLTVVLLGASAPALAAGNCDAEVDDGELIIECDDLGNDIRIEETGGLGSGVFTITGRFGTTVNGLGADIVSGVDDDVTVDLGDGEDVLTFTRSAIPGDLDVSGGDGFKDVSVRGEPLSTVDGDIEVETDDGGSRVDVSEGTIVDGDVCIENGDGGQHLYDG